jgi:transposase
VTIVPGAAVPGAASRFLTVRGTSSARPAVIPPGRNRRQPRQYDRTLHKLRNLVKRFMSRIKRFRGVATGYEKTSRDFLAFVQVASIIVLLS